MEPAYPGAVGHYINLGDCYDRKSLHALTDDFKDLGERYRDLYARAYQCLHASKEVRTNGERGFVTDKALSKMEKRVKGIISRELKKRNGITSKEKKRFLGAISCEGAMQLYESIDAQAKRVYELQDPYGVSYKMLEMLRKAILNTGYDVISFFSPEEPDRLEHLLVPELSLAFVRTWDKNTDGKRPYRRIRMESLLEKDFIKYKRPQFKFSQRIANELRVDAIEELKKAKDLHDEMEDLYAPFVDFKKVNNITDKLIAEINSFV